MMYWNVIVDGHYSFLTKGSNLRQAKINAMRWLGTGDLPKNVEIWRHNDIPRGWSSSWWWPEWSGIENWMWENRTYRGKSNG